MSKKISVVTPCLNSEKYLEDTICSVLDQRYDNLQYIIVDGGSRDRTIQIIKKYEKHLFTWISEKDQGQYFAINKGFNLCDGEIMTWINADDILLPWTFKTVNSAFTNFESLEWLADSRALINEDGFFVYFDQNEPYSTELLKQGAYDGLQIHHLQQEGVFWSRELWKKAGRQLDTSFQLAADFELWLRFSQLSNITTIKSLLGIFRRHTANRSQLNLDRYQEEVAKAKIKHCCPKNIIPDESYPAQYLEYSYKESDWLIHSTNIKSKS